MDHDRDALIDYRLHALHARGDTLEDLANLLDTSSEAISQRVSRFHKGLDAPTRNAADDPRLALSDALAWGDEEAFLEIIAENPERFRWINPAALNGSEALRSHHAEQITQLTAGEEGNPFTAECVTVILPNQPSPMASIELLQSVIPRAKKLVLVSSRTALRTLLADPF